jgi:hypothetical protein
VALACLATEVRGPKGTDSRTFCTNVHFWTDVHYWTGMLVLTRAAAWLALSSA